MSAGAQREAEFRRYFSVDVFRAFARPAGESHRLFLKGLLVAISYYLAVQIGFELKPPSHPISAFWPPNALLLATFLIVPRKQWWYLVIAVLPAHLLVQLPRGVPIATSFGWYLGNTAEGLFGAYLITEFQDPRDSFGRVRGLLVFLAFGVIGAPFLTSFVDAGVVISTGVGHDFWYVWATRLLSNMLAELTVVPCIVLFPKQNFLRASWKRYVEALLLALAFFAASLFAFGPVQSEMRKDQSFYMALVLLAWATLRFQFVGLCTTLLAVSLTSSWAVVHGHASSLGSPDNVLPLQLFLIMVALPSMFVAVALVQQSETANSLRASKIQLVNSQERERSRIARELHDGVGQLLSLLELELTKLRAESDSEMKSKLENVGRQVNEISQATHDISHGLHSFHLEYLGLSAAIKKLCTDIAKEHVLSVYFDEAQIPAHLNSEVSLSFYRIAQEALNNAVKYSRAQQVKVRLRVKSGRLSLEIDDDGVGFISNGNASAGMGLTSMRERMESIGGTVSIRSNPGNGTRVHASIPLRNAA